MDLLSKEAFVRNIVDLKVLASIRSVVMSLLDYIVVSCFTLNNVILGFESVLLDVI